MLIICDVYECFGYVGCGYVLVWLCEKYWIVGVNFVVC